MAVCDTDETAARRAKEKFDAKSCYTDYRDLLRQEEIDVVDVVTPIHVHASIVAEAAETGINVICEKPMADNLEDCDSMIRAGRKNHIKLMIAHSRRFWRKNILIKHVLENGSIGKILVQKQLEERPKDYRPLMKHVFSSQTNPLGSMLGMGGHSIDLFRWFLQSNIKRVFAIGRTTKSGLYPRTDVLDHAKAMFAFEDGSKAFIETNDSGPRGCPYWFPVFEIVGTKGRINASDCVMVSVVASYDSHLSIPFSDQQFMVGQGNPFFDELRYFARCVLEDKEPDYVTLEDARAVVEGALAAAKSMRQGEPVTLPL